MSAKYFEFSNGYYIDDKIVAYAQEFLEENKKYFDDFSSNCIHGGAAVQYHLKEVGAPKDSLRPIKDIDLLFKERMRKSEFNELVGKLKIEDYFIDKRITRSSFEICISNGEDSICINIPYYTSEKYGKNISWIKETVENARELNVIDFPVESEETAIEKKTRRALYYLEKLGIDDPKNYFNDLVREMIELIKYNPAEAKKIYLDKREKFLDTLKKEGDFHSPIVQEKCGIAKIYKDAYDIACLKYFCSNKKYPYPYTMPL